MKGGNWMRKCLFFLFFFVITSLYPVCKQTALLLIPSGVNCLVQENQRLYVCDQSSHLSIVSATNPDHLTILSTITLPATGNAMQLVNNNLVIACGTSGIVIISIQNDNSPQIRCHLQLPANILALSSYFNTIYATTGTTAIYAIDVTSFDQPEAHLINTPATNPVTTLYAHNASLYLTDGKVYQFELTHPLTPAYVSSLSFSNYVNDLLIQNDTLYVSMGKKGILVNHINNDNTITQLDSIPVLILASNMKIHHQQFFYLDERFGIYINDMNQSFSNLSSYGSEFFPSGYSIAGNRLFLAERQTGIHTIDISQPRSNLALWETQNNQLYLSLQLVNNRLFTSNGNGLRYFEITSNTQIEEKGFIGTGGYCRRLRQNGNYLYMSASWRGIFTFDISDINAPYVAYNFTDQQFADDMLTLDNVVYGAYGNAGFYVIDATNPASLTLAQLIHTDGYVCSFATYGNYLYVAEAEKGIEVYSITDLFSPQYLACIDTPGSAAAIAIKDRIAYVADKQNGLLLFDLSTPFNPTLLTTIKPNPDCWIDVAPYFIGDYMLLSDNNWNELLTYNIQNPEQPLLNQRLCWNVSTFDFLSYEQSLFTANSRGGGHLLPLSSLISNNTLQNSVSSFIVKPNPWSRFLTIQSETPNTNPISVDCYNCKGQLLRSIHSNNASLLMWDGKDSQGQQIPCGIYFLRIHQGNNSLTKKCVYFH